MIHPLIGDLSHLKETELEEKISSLSKKYFRATGGDMKEQIVMVLDIYRAELANRRQARWQKEYEKRNKDLDTLINVD